MFLQLFINGLAMGAIYALVALGFVLVSNAVNVVNFSQGEWVMLGAYFAVTASVAFHTPLIWAYLISVVVMILFGWLFQRAVYHPLRDKPFITIVISTIGVSLFLKNIARIIWGPQPTTFPSLFGENALDVFGVHILPQNLIIIAVTVILVILQELFFNRTMVGKMMRATAQDQEASSLMGIRVSRMVSFTFMYSAALTAIAGVLVAPIYFVSADMGGNLALKAFAAAIIGGFNNVRGAIIGGLLLGVLETFGAGYISSVFKDAFTFFILILFLAFRPEGIFRERIADKV
ncbi:branched-chain amino acid ABC transporter permease [Paenibacillus filicis]|uniref:Branched-chain amino acid ABC transporter permease n=1 Tax=Paenibacillus gyeongsangnamensis TaxID=3388067 RepID=A0ABT4QDZ9_9BACL|nr:branched-chain amino acid ABC transporter permease [Paenibacillus filicis]MCZ8515100.1 branched-chain amino acid ABC transporter permease [Paenibacillus filicis]